MIADKERFFKILVVVTSLLGSVYILWPFLPVLLLAAVIAFAIQPLILKIRGTRWFNHASCIYLLVTGLFLVITVPFLLVLSKIYSMILALDLAGEGKKSALESFNRHRSELMNFLKNLTSQFGIKTLNIESLVSDGFQQLFGRILEGSTYLVTQIPDVLFSFAVFLVALFLCLRYATQIARVFYSSGFLKRHESQDVVSILKQSSYAAVFSSLITGLVQSTIVSVGAGILMDVDVTLIFIITFLCSFIPVIGAAPMAFLLAIISFAKGESGAGIALVVIGFITGTIDNIIRVVLLKMVKEELHPFIELMAVIGGVIVLGLPGLFLGPVIISATAQLVPKLVGGIHEPKK